MIELQGITKSFGTLQVLKGIDLMIEKGEVARRILQNCKSKKETTDTGGTSMKTVILTSFKSDVRAHMLQDLLKNEGIESMLQGEYTAQVLAYIPGMEIKVLVFEKDYAQAFEILKASFPEKV